MNTIANFIVIFLLLFGPHLPTDSYQLLGSKLYGSPYTPAETISIGNLTLYAYGSVPNGVRAFIFADQNGTPGVLLAEGSANLPAIGEMTQITVPLAARLQAGTPYWIAIEMVNESCATRVQPGGQMMVYSHREWSPLEDSLSLWFTANQGHQVFAPYIAQIR